ncbi:ATP-binding protein [Wenjunlia tyrosinilytica]|uniref:Orc1-like AAA ATPase domain-containing protein n=1 Tax=Wenjunlia tyrosinilytica TaxID=1544741 RepID=A0A917ZX26_9ACTN|nr:ATP-binding protein [Wenjunlia tyrosinilytica]GGO97788.1 hypothetical protein GCM10012280_60400 [Wenjunlia tyrosinilytica]
MIEHLTTSRSSDRRLGRPLEDEASLLFGRDAEQAVLRHLARLLGAGSPTATALYGLPGSGRSSLLRQAASFARAAGAQVLTAWGIAAEERTPFGLVRRLTDQRSPDPDPRSVHEDCLVRPVGGNLVERWCRVFLAAADDRPTMIAVDDVQWADPQSRQVLQALLRRISRAPLALAVTVSGTNGEFPRSCVELVDQIDSFKPYGQLLHLGPLSHQAVGAMCAAGRVGGGDRDWYGRAAELTRGNPAVLNATLSSLRRDGAVDLWAELPVHAAVANGTRVAELSGRLGPGPLGLLRGLVACRGLLPVERVARLVGLDDADTDAALRALRLEGLVDADDAAGLSFPSAVEPALYGMDGAERRRLLGEAARSAHRAAVADDLLARLLLRTEPLGDPWVSGVLRRAAHACRAAGHHAEAARYLERALREPLDPVQRAEVLLEAGATQSMVAPETAFRRLVEVLSAPPGVGNADTRVGAADLLLTLGDAATTRQAIARMHAWEKPPSERRPVLLGLYWLADGARQGRSGLDDADPDMPPLDLVPEHPTAQAASAWRAAAAGTHAAHVRALGAAVLGTPARGLPLYPRLLACRALGVADAPQAARAGLDAAVAEARRRHAPALVGVALLLRSELSLRVGDVDAAARDLSASRVAMPWESWYPTMVPGPLALEVLVNIARQRWEEAEHVAFQQLPPGAEHGFAWTHLLYARGMLRLYQGMPHEALAESRECGRRLRAQGWLNPGLLPWRSLAAVAHHRCGDPEPAADLLAEEVRLAREWGTASALGWAEYRAAMVSTGPQAAIRMERAVRRLRESPMVGRYTQVMGEVEGARRFRAGRRRQSAGAKEAAPGADRPPGLPASARGAPAGRRLHPHHPVRSRDPPGDRFSCCFSGRAN